MTHTEYRGTLQRPDLPAVDLGSPGAPSWFAPEHLQILPNQIWSKIIPDRVAEAFHGVSRQNPKANRGRIEREGIDCFRKGQGDELVSCTSPIRLRSLTMIQGDCRFIHLNSTMLSIPSTSLPYPSIMYRNTNAARVDGYRWNLGNKKFLSPPVPSVSWTFLCEQGVAPIAFQNFEHHFETQLAACGVVNQAAHVTKLGATHTLDFGSDKYGRDNRLKYITLQLENIARESPDIVVLMLRQKNQEHYSMFKYLADKMFVIHSICVTEANFKPKPKPLYRDGPLLDWTHPNAPRHWTQYAANVVMKANLKNSGWNHSASGIEPTLKDTLILGADLTHPGTSAVEGCPSIAAVVGSVHSSGGKFPGMLRLQPKVEVGFSSSCVRFSQANSVQLVVHLQSMVQAILERWCKLHRKWPARIIYYRDGVSKGEYPDIIKHELSGIKKAISALAQQKRMEEPDIKLAVIIVTKRHHTRFYPAKPADQTSTEWPVNENLKPGTLVDSAVTNPYFVDFYLQTHIGIIGTARPARYDIIHNSTGYSTGRLRDLVSLRRSHCAWCQLTYLIQTHNLNHTYVRATLGVSYAAPAYYADRLCERGRCYLREWYNPSSDKRDEFRRKKLEFQKAQPRSNMNGTKPVKSNAKTQHDLDVEEANREEVNKKMKDYAGQQILPRWYVSKANTTPPSWWPTHLDPYRGNESEFHDTMYWM
jgi:eukaryotic translation initiation factor 2C